MREVALGNKHHLRKSADRKAQIKKAFVPVTELICAFRSAGFLRWCLFPKRNLTHNLFFLFPIVFGINWIVAGFIFFFCLFLDWLPTSRETTTLVKRKEEEIPPGELVRSPAYQLKVKQINNQWANKQTNKQILARLRKVELNFILVIDFQGDKINNSRGRRIWQNGMQWSKIN